MAALLHSTWHKLGFEGTNDLGKENKDEYIARLSKIFPNMPESVLGQWTYLHHRNSEIQKLYGWIDYSKVKFELVSWNPKQILQIKAFPKFERYIAMTDEKIRTTASLAREGSKKDTAHWTEFGTWRTPILVLDAERFSPTTVKFEKPYQLIEGHTRMGWFRAFGSFSNYQHPYRLSSTHELFLMTL